MIEERPKHRLAEDLGPYLQEIEQGILEATSINNIMPLGENSDGQN